MTAHTFQGWGLTYEWSWFLATIAGILLIALPLMLAVAMIIYAERKIWAAMRFAAGPTWSARSACCRASPTASRSSSRKPSSRPAPTRACS
jgi:NADH:ubiquinone oxidoreductase subunit H